MVMNVFICLAKDYEYPGMHGVGTQQNVTIHTRDFSCGSFAIQLTSFSRL